MFVGSVRFGGYEYLKRKSLYQSRRPISDSIDCGMRSFVWGLQAETIARIFSIPFLINEARHLPSLFPLFDNQQKLVPINFIPHFLEIPRFAIQISVYEALTYYSVEYPLYDEVKNWNKFVLMKMNASLSASFITGFVTFVLFTPIELFMEHILRSSNSGRRTRVNYTQKLMQKMGQPLRSVAKTVITLTVYEAFKLIAFL